MPFLRDNLVIARQIDRRRAFRCNLSQCLTFQPIDVMTVLWHCTRSFATRWGRFYFLQSNFSCVVPPTIAVIPRFLSLSSLHIALSKKCDALEWGVFTTLPWKKIWGGDRGDRQWIERRPSRLIICKACTAVHDDDQLKHGSYGMAEKTQLIEIVMCLLALPCPASQNVEKCLGYVHGWTWASGYRRNVQSIETEKMIVLTDTGGLVDRWAV